VRNSLTWLTAGPYNRRVRLRSAALTVLVLVSGAAAQDAVARAAVEAFVARMSAATLTDLVIDQSVTAYVPDGRNSQSSVDQRVFIKPPGRQRVEQWIDGQRVVQIVVGDRGWLRGADGHVLEVPASAGPRRDRLDLLLPRRRGVADVLAEWRALGIRDDVTSMTRVAGRPVTVIGAQSGNRDSPAVWLDPEFGVVRLITRERLPAGPALIDLTLSEHRRVAGSFAYPCRQETFVDGRLVLLVIVRAVAVDTGLADALFDPAALHAGG